MSSTRTLTSVSSKSSSTLRTPLILRKIFKNAPKNETTVQAQTPSLQQQQQQQQQQKPASSSSSHIMTDALSRNSFSDDTRPLLLEQIFLDDVDLTSNLIQERDNDIRELETAMQDVNLIYKDLAALTNAQGEYLDSIECNISKAETHTSEGTRQLGQASIYQKKSRTMLCTILGVVTVVVVIVVLVAVL